MRIELKNNTSACAVCGKLPIIHHDSDETWSIECPKCSMVIPGLKTETMCYSAWEFHNERRRHEVELEKSAKSTKKTKNKQAEDLDDGWDEDFEELFE